ncbi:hypothetical protein PLICRDRAFT_371411 [Plicaturopsis crispa FD-325 SS-3]|uniref:Uncharacterized protein n=1 Tax=Plicaturopsis crispa FD-325 SS-3 TaxID=944288 RepID=A0A0C9SKQ4_PLICR|nr:hypothetical protein PLICRDRAFT_371411 [Plicaturopsis crispa FD-325 SS-3]
MSYLASPRKRCAADDSPAPIRLSGLRRSSWEAVVTCSMEPEAYEIAFGELKALSL